MKHFEFYPKVEYSDNLSVNIMVRGKIRDLILKNTALYYKYTIKDSDRPDIIAKNYYGTHAYTWAIFYANNIFHPILEWPMSHWQFNDYIKLKYGSIEFAQNTLKEPHHYEIYDKELKKTFIVDKKTYLNRKSEYDQTTQQPNFYTQDVEYAMGYPDFYKPVYLYDYELSLNENKRNIVVLDKEYLYEIANELKNLFV